MSANPDEEYLESIRLEISPLLKSNIPLALEKARYLNERAKEAFNDKYIGASFALMGFCYFHNREFDQSIKYYLKSRPYFLKIKDIHKLLSTYTAIGAIYRNKGMVEKALATYLESICIQKKQ